MLKHTEKKNKIFERDRKELFSYRLFPLFLSGMAVSSIWIAVTLIRFAFGAFCFEEEMEFLRFLSIIFVTPTLGGYFAFYPPDEIYENGINYSIKFSLRPYFMRHIFIPFKSIKSFSFPKFSEEQYKEYREWSPPYVFFGLPFPFGNKGIYDRYQMSIDTTHKIKGKDRFYLDYTLAIEFMPVLKRVLGPERWEKLADKNCKDFEKWVSEHKEEEKES